MSDIDRRPPSSTGDEVSYTQSVSSSTTEKTALSSRVGGDTPGITVSEVTETDTQQKRRTEDVEGDKIFFTEKNVSSSSVSEDPIAERERASHETSDSEATEKDIQRLRDNFEYALDSDVSEGPDRTTNDADSIVSDFGANTGFPDTDKSEPAQNIRAPGSAPVPEPNTDSVQQHADSSSKEAGVDVDESGTYQVFNEEYLGDVSQPCDCCACRKCEDHSTSELPSPPVDYGRMREPCSLSETDDEAAPVLASRDRAISPATSEESESETELPRIWSKRADDVE